MSRIAACRVALLLLLLAGACPERSAHAGDSPEEITTPVRAWYAALEADAESDLAAFYLPATPTAARRQHVAKLQGVPVAYGAEIVLGDEAWIQVHAGTGEHLLVAWRRVGGSWKVLEMVPLSPELFLRRRFTPIVASWPSKSEGSRSAAGVIFALAKAYQDPKARETLTAKILEAKYLHPVDPTDREGYGDLLDDLSQRSVFLEVHELEERGPESGRTAKALLRLSEEHDLTLAKTAEGWRIVTARKRPRARPAPPSEAAQAAAIAVARRVFSAIETGDAKAYASLALDLTSSKPRTMSVERAKTQIAALQRGLGGKFDTRKPRVGQGPGGSFNVMVDAPGAPVDPDNPYAAASPWAHAELVLVGGALRLLAVNDGRESELVSIDSVTAPK